MLLGLVYLHQHRILHRDIKAGNVLLTSSGQVKLADFGVAAKLTHTLQKRNTMVGSPYWMAPEVISQKKKEGYDFKTDIWSLGITAIELAEGKPPLFDVASLRVIFLIPARDPPTLKEPTMWSASFAEFLATCLQKLPENRPSAHELLENSFIKGGMIKAQSSLLTDMVRETMPLLVEMRQAKKNAAAKEREAANESDDEGGTLGTSGLRPGMILTVNTTSGEWTERNSTKTASGGGTTVINQGDINNYLTTKINNHQQESDSD